MAVSQLSELRRIIVGDQADQLSQLKDRLERVSKRSKDVAEVLPAAIKLSHKEGSGLGRSLSPIMTQAIDRAIRQDPEKFADAFYPVMAPSIRLMIANSIRSLLASINQSVESATTVKGFRWRMESVRTGVPYAEVALRHALQYRVEQVFVIQKQSGLLVDHLVNENVVGLDSDAVSAMLTAIQSFVRESFSASADENLTNMSVGDLKVWLVHGANAVLACVIRGEAPLELRNQLQDVVDQIHVKYSFQLENLQDQEVVFPGIHDLLEPCLQLKVKDYQGKRKSISLTTIVLLAALLLGAGYWLVTSWQENKVRNQVTRILADTPGILPTNVSWQGDKLQVLGLMDPVAEVPIQQLAEQGVAESQLQMVMKQFRSLEPEIAERRLRTSYQIPDNLTLALEEPIERPVLTLTGELEYQQYRALKDSLLNSSQFNKVVLTELKPTPGSLQTAVEKRFGLEGGVTVQQTSDSIVDIGGLPNLSWLSNVAAYLGEDNIGTVYAPELVDQLKITVAQSNIAFTDGAELSAEQQETVANVAETFAKLNQVLRLQQSEAKLIVVAATDASGSAELNAELRELRSNAVVSALREAGLSAEELELSQDSQRLERVVYFRLAESPLDE